jgi:putative sigma-54 modulation protein
MHIIITGVHIEITDAIRSYILDKVSSLEKLVPKDDTSAKLTIELSKISNHHTHGEHYQAEALLHIRGKESTLKTTQEDLYKAVDVLKDMLSRDMSTHKDKERSLVRRSAHKVKALLKRLV